MDNKHETKRTCFFKYNDGHWQYSDKDKWTINTGKLLKEAATKLKNSATLGCLINRLNSTNKLHIKNNNYQKQGLFRWLTDDTIPAPKIERSQAICLKHFVEHILSDSSIENENNYLIVANIVGQCITVQVETSGKTPSSSVLSVTLLYTF